MAVDLTIKNCKVWYRNKALDLGIGIDRGKIVSISKDVKLPKSDEKINCRGKIVLPGLVDVHVHFREPGLTWKEDWSTGSKATAKGGITFVMDMPNTNPATTTVERLLEKKKLAKKSVVNFGLYAGIGEENIDDIKQLSNHADAFKIYMSQSTGELKLTDNDLLMNAFTEVSNTGKLVSVHAENQKMNERFLKMYKKRDDPLAYSFSRPAESEILAINDAIELAKQTRVKLHICHVTTEGGVNLIRKAKQKGIDITCETCPHYLFMTREDLKEKKTLVKMNPPLRTKKDQVALWKGISDRTIDIIASDHAPHTLEEKLQDIWLAPAGVPGVETTLPLMLKAVNKKMITLGRLVELMHENPVKRFGLNYGIEKGNPANLTIIDLKKEWKISNDELLTKCGWSPYEGWKGKGMAVMTIVNGNMIYS